MHIIKKNIHSESFSLTICFCCAILYKSPNLSHRYESQIITNERFKSTCDRRDDILTCCSNRLCQEDIIQHEFCITQDTIKRVNLDLCIQLKKIIMTIFRTIFFTFKHLFLISLTLCHQICNPFQLRIRFNTMLHKEYAIARNNRFFKFDKIIHIQKSSSKLFHLVVIYQTHLRKINMLQRLINHSFYFNGVIFISQ